MKISDLSVGTRVDNKKYGRGTVCFIDTKECVVTVDFDNITDGKKRRTFIPSALTKLDEQKQDGVAGSQKTNQPKVGYVVEHKKFGKGIIVSLDKSNEFALIDFDNEIDGKRQRNMSLSFLTIYIPNQDDNKEIINIGDNVFHKQHGKGIVVGECDKYRHYIKFDNRDGDISINDSELTVLIKNILEEDEVSEDEINTNFRIVPANYSAQTCYSTEAKKLLTRLRKNNQDGLATIKSYKEGMGEVGVFISPKKGVIVFKLINSENDFAVLSSDSFKIVLDTDFNNFRKYYLDRILMSKKLCQFVDDSYKTLKYPIRFVFLFQNIDLEKFTDYQRNKLCCLNKNIFFKNFTSPIKDNDLFCNFENYDVASFKEIDSEDKAVIVERIIPENALLLNIKPEERHNNIQKSKNPQFLPITGKEREFNALCLDDTQIRMINDTKPGHYLTLANPGTGKSILLVSKAFRIQSIQNKNHVLITCYNKNLANQHKVFAEVSGMKTPFLHIETFLKLVKDILKEKDPTFIRMLNLFEQSEDSDDKFAEMVERFDRLLSAGIIDTAFDAVFIDEVQLFEPKWIDIVYRLLNKSVDRDYYFEMFGDINQDVKSQRSKGKASWQNTNVVPPLTGRVKRLDINYRNTDIISNYLTSMIGDFNSYLKSIGLEHDKDNECLSSKAIRKGHLKVKVLTTANDNFSKIAQLINELVKKKGASYHEIAVVYPASKHAKSYNLLFNIENMFDAQNIPFNLIHGDETVGREKRYSLIDCDGVIMSTIDSCLGLDFKYVFLCGLHYWDYVHVSGNGKSNILCDDLINKNPEVKQYICEVGKKIYSACSRAREGLYIFDDTNYGSPVKRIIRPHSGRKYYDEN